MKPDVLEGILTEQYAHPAFLPPHQRVLFQEAVRGNHLIFPKTIIDLADSVYTKWDDNRVAKVCTQLLAAGTIKDMRYIVRFSGLTQAEQVILFKIYQGYIKYIQRKLQRGLN